MTALSLISNWDRIARVCMCPSICNKAAVICLTIGKQNELGGNRAYSRKESDKILVTGLSRRLIKNHVWSNLFRARRFAPRGMPQSTLPMSNPSGFTVKVRNDRDIIISKPEAGFEVT